MTWSPLTKAENFYAGGSPFVTELSVTSGVALSVGQTVFLCVTHDNNAGSPATGSVMQDATNGNNRDSLNNLWTKEVEVTGSNNQMGSIWKCIVTVAGTPTIRIRFNPTPGTSNVGNVTLSLEPFSGSDANSVTDGTPTGQLQNAPGTGTDVITSGALTTTVPGAIVFGCVIDTQTGTDTCAHGTGFTDGQATNASGVVIRSEWLEKVAAGSQAATFTSAGGGGTDNFLTLVVAVTPGAGGVAPDAQALGRPNVLRPRPFAPGITR